MLLLLMLLLLTSLLRSTAVKIIPIINTTKSPIAAAAIAILGLVHLADEESSGLSASVPSPAKLGKCFPVGKKCPGHTPGFF